MTRAWTEAAIRETLDGTFTRVMHDNSIKVLTVDKNFIPSHGRAIGRQLGDTGTKQTYWTPEEEDLLIRQRMRNRPFAEIAWLLSRSVDATKKHHALLRVRGRA